MFNNHSSVFILLYNNVGYLFSYYYFLIITVVGLLFLSYRLPYCYSPYLFFIFLLVVVFTMFISLFLTRLWSSVNEFFCSFIPVGTPMYICPLVCLAETVSYVIRPIVLILRPFINISLGSFGAVALCNLCFLSFGWFIILFIIFLYEVFVAVIHWYIVTSILSFSIDH